jgi:hypothetical protein
MRNHLKIRRSTSVKVDVPDLKIFKVKDSLEVAGDVVRRRNSIFAVNAEHATGTSVILDDREEVPAAGGRIRKTKSHFISSFSRCRNLACGALLPIMGEAQTPQISNAACRVSGSPNQKLSTSGTTVLANSFGSSDIDKNADIDRAMLSKARR